MKKIFVLLGIVVALTGCQNVKEKTSAMGDFFEAVASGDIERLKKYKKNKNDDKSWNEVDQTTEKKDETKEEK